MSLIEKIWRNKGAILEGIKNSLIKKDHIEAIASKRLTICTICPLIDEEGSKCEVPGTQPCCGECGCSLYLKTRSLSSECPHPDGSRWQALLTMEEEDKLYNELDYDPEGE